MTDIGESDEDEEPDEDDEDQMSQEEWDDILDRLNNGELEAEQDG